MHLPPTPQPRDLLPPLLACLPTTFVSPRPPPALLPLLAPILRQRINFLSATTSNESRDGWVRLLCWDSQRAAKLPSVVESLQLEPHPVSGEVEIEDVRAIKYRRLDTETLQSRLEADQFDLLPVYVWCETDEHGGTGPGWKLSELRSLEDLEDGSDWFDSITEANNAGSDSKTTEPNGANENGTSTAHTHHQQDHEEQEEDDDDYWASYDRTPNRTPAQKRSPAPRQMGASAASRARSQSEADYYARYGAEVQPALDTHDPDEEHPEIGESTLNGTTQRELAPEAELASITSSQAQKPADDKRSAWEKALYPHGHMVDSAIEQNLHSGLSMPRPISPASSQSSVERLEEQAAAMEDSKTEEQARAEMGIKQHISTDIKSLFRLANSVGMNRKEFERIVKTELDCLAMMDRDE